MAFPHCVRMSKITYFIVITFVVATRALCPHQDDSSVRADYLDIVPGEDYDATGTAEGLFDDNDLEEQLDDVSEDGSTTQDYREEDTEKTRMKKSMMGLFGLATKRPQFHKTILEGNHFMPKGNFLPVRGKKTPWRSLRSPFGSSYNLKYRRPVYGPARRFFSDCPN